MKCPSNCSRPCEKICPTSAIDYSGVKENKCYGCGRCINSCPLNLISEYEYNLSNTDLPNKLKAIKPDAVEIHTEINRIDSFRKVANLIKNSGIKLKKKSVSCGLNQSKKKPIDLSKALWDRYEILLEHNVPVSYTHLTLPTTPYV